MSTRPILQTFNQLAPMFVQEYERYLPTAFDESMTILQKMNKIIQYMNEVGALTAGLIDKWNEVMEWVMADGLSEAVSVKLDEMVANGTLADIINIAIFEDLNRKIENVAIDITSVPYNAKRNTDIGAILTTVIDRVHADGGGTVKIPAGTYIIDGSVDLPSNITIIGDKGGTILKKTAAASEGYMFTVGRTTKFGAKAGYGGGAKNVAFEGIQFEGYAPSKTEYRALALSFHHADNLTFKECRFYNCITRDHAIDLAGCSNVFIEHCSFEGAYNLEGREYNECIQIDSSAPTALPQFHSYDGLPTKNVTITDCQFIPSYYPNGALFNYAPHPVGNHGQTGGKPYENIVFINNLVKDGQPRWNTSGWRGWLHFYGMKNLKINNNRFINTMSINAAVISIITSSGGWYDPNTYEATVGVPVTNEDIEVTGNTFEGFNYMQEKHDLIRMYGTEYQGVEYPVKNILISGNVFLKNSSVSLTDEYGQCCANISLFRHLTITDNVVELAGRMFSVWNGKHVNISNNTGLTISNNFLFHSTVEDSVVSGNNVRTSRQPIEAQEIKNFIFMGNIFTDARQLGIDNYSLKFRNLTNANIIGNLVQTNSTAMSFGLYVYSLDTLGASANVNNFDNMAVGFTVRPYNTSGVMTNYNLR